MGLVNRLVPSVHVLDEAMQLARRMARNGPLAMRKAKEVMVSSNGLPFDEAYRIESRAAGVVMASADAMEVRVRSSRSAARISPARDPSAEEAGMRRIGHCVVYGAGVVSVQTRGDLHVVRLSRDQR